MRTEQSSHVRTSTGQILSDAQVARLEARRQVLGLTRTALLHRFEAALKNGGSVHTAEAAKMRLDRVFNMRMRKPMSEETRLALATALEWSIPQFQKAIGVNLRIIREKTAINRVVLSRDAAEISDNLVAVSQWLQEIARTLHTLPENIHSKFVARNRHHHNTHKARH